ncbi:ribosome-associated translation inhibitor RaiA [Candidatus Parcubacteria bacterium]|nr:ribosome-associated translation inhibitor RaiA [Candidatus Parcubacteria bacterium]MBI4385643.1 ribosome-associated translation inhibitor RaiA [Candidatus Parcubacteria bacterium]
MKLQVKVTNLQLTDSIRAHIFERLGSLDRVVRTWGREVEGHLEIGRTTRHHRQGAVYKAELNVRFPGGMVRVVREGEDVHAVVDELRDEMLQEIAKYKGKRRELFERGARALKFLKSLSPAAWFKREKKKFRR